MSLGIVLSGGGARGAYQSGVLRGIAELLGSKTNPFGILAGTSAGSINATALAVDTDDFQFATEKLWNLWATLTPSLVFKTDPGTLTRIGFDWVTDLSLGGWLGSGGRARALLDTTPLRELLTAHFDYAEMRRNLREGKLEGLAVTATSYDTGLAVTFFDGASKCAPWERTTRVGVRTTTIGLEHVLASCAIPLFFPAVSLNGPYYADGCVRMSTPLSPALHLGAERVLAIGVRHPAPPILPPTGPRPYPSKAETAGVLLDALFMDALESDVERAERINRTLKLIPPASVGTDVTLRPVPVMLLQPSVDLGLLAIEALQHFPTFLKHLLRGLGADSESGGELVSYLAFDSPYTTRLLELGRQDALAHKDALKAFLEVG